MPRYYGEGPREMYWTRDDKWYHSRRDGRSFNTYEEAKRDYDAHIDDSYDGCGCIIVAIIVVVISVVLII